MVSMYRKTFGAVSENVELSSHVQCPETVRLTDEKARHDGVKGTSVAGFLVELAKITGCHRHALVGGKCRRCEVGRGMNIRNGDRLELVCTMCVIAETKRPGIELMLASALGAIENVVRGKQLMVGNLVPFNTVPSHADLEHQTTQTCSRYKNGIAASLLERRSW